MNKLDNFMLVHFRVHTKKTKYKHVDLGKSRDNTGLFVSYLYVEFLICGSPHVGVVEMRPQWTKYGEDIGRSGVQLWVANGARSPEAGATPEPALHLHLPLHKVVIVLVRFLQLFSTLAHGNDQD